MTYTAEQLRDMASLIEEQEVPADGQQIKMLRAHADALEENARLRAELGKFSDRNGYALRQRAERAEAALTELRQHAEENARLKSILSDTRDQLQAHMTLDSAAWEMKLERAEAALRELTAERERADRNERDAERWRYWRVRPTHWNWFSARSIHTWKTPAQLDADTDAAIDAARGK